MQKNAKRKIRQDIAAAIKGMPTATRESHERALLAKATALAQFIAAKTVAAYHPLPDEIDITPLLRNALATGKRLVLPLIDNADGAHSMTMRLVEDMERDLALGIMGIMEPLRSLPEIAPNCIDLVIVPGRAFSPACLRLGRGAGYYDRFLSHTPAFKLALAHDSQILDNLPVEAHDLPVDMIITPTREFRRMP